MKAALARTVDDQQYELSVDGITRSFIEHLPAGASVVRGLPVLLAFHGFGGTDSEMGRLTHLDTVSDADRFLVVYPQGYQRSWNDGRTGTAANQAGIDDVHFVSVLIDQLIAEGVDAHRIYATGISNGGMFTQRLGCELAGKLAGIAPVAGPLPTQIAPSCHPSRPIPVLEIHGTSDPIVPFDGGTITGRASGGTVLSVHDTVTRWTAQDKCTTAPVTNPLPNLINDGTSVTVTISTDCANGTKVADYTVINGGHTWPGGQQYLPVLIVGQTTHQFDASRTIWEFFTAQ
jgi:polyhydroxybutyrate depolymerase